jgi:hypothetical protein
MVTMTKRDETSFTTRAFSWASITSELSASAARRMPSQATTLMARVDGADDGGQREAEWRAQLLLPGDDSHGLVEDPDRAAQHAEADHEIGDLLQLAGAVFQFGQGPAMDPAQDGEGEELDRDHQDDPDGLRQDGEGTPDQADEQEDEHDKDVRRQGEDQRAFFFALMRGDGGSLGHREAAPSEPQPREQDLDQPHLGKIDIGGVAHGAGLDIGGWARA